MKTKFHIPLLVISYVLLSLLMDMTNKQGSYFYTSAGAQDLAAAVEGEIDVDQLKNGYLEGFVKQLKDFIIGNRRKNDMQAAKEAASYRHRSTHAHHAGHFAKGQVNTEAEWDSIQGVQALAPLDSNAVITLTELDTIKLMPDKQVFGWHPYWMGSAYQHYHYNLLSVVSYFSYELDPKTGGYKTIHNWRETGLVDSAHSANPDCKVLLTVSNFGATNNAEFLSNSKAQATFMDTLVSLLKLKGADGVNIDFENVPKRQRDDLTNFIDDLEQRLHKENEDYMVTLAVYAVDVNEVFDIQHLNPVVDLFVIMGYDFHGSWGNAGPVAPLESGKIWWKYNLETAVSHYLDRGAPKKKLLLGLPYYGGQWITPDLTIPSTGKDQYQGAVTYRKLREDSLTYALKQLDTISKSGYAAYLDAVTYRQYWFEDDTSLSIKYDYVLEQGIGGIGVWALGYDHGYDDLWMLMAEKFAGEPSEEEAPEEAPAAEEEEAPAEWDVAQMLDDALEFRRVIVLVLCILIGFCLVGFLIAFSDYEVRSTLMSKRAFFYYAVFIILGLIVALLRVYNILNTETMLILGVVLGFAASKLSKWFAPNKEELP